MGGAILLIAGFSPVFVAPQVVSADYYTDYQQNYQPYSPYSSAYPQNYLYPPQPYYPNNYNGYDQYAPYAPYSNYYNGNSFYNTNTQYYRPLVVSCRAEKSSVDTGSTLRWTAKVSGGTGQYTYSWGTRISQVVHSSLTSMTSIARAPGTDEAALIITSGGLSKTTFCGTVSVRGSSQYDDYSGYNNFMPNPYPPYYNYNYPY